MRGYPTRSLFSGRSDRSARQVHPGAQAAMRRGFEAYIAAMAARHIARDRQAEANPAGRRIARGVEADERVKHPLAFSRRDARPVIVDQDVDPGLDGPDPGPGRTPGVAGLR